MHLINSSHQDNNRPYRREVSHSFAGHWAPWTLPSFITISHQIASPVSTSFRWLSVFLLWSTRRAATLKDISIAWFIELSRLSYNKSYWYNEQAWKSGNMLVSVSCNLYLSLIQSLLQHRSTQAAVDGRRASPDNYYRPPLSIVNQYPYLFKVHYDSSNISGMGRDYNPKEKDVERLN